MIRTEIYVENNRLELSKDISSEFTYNVDDVKDFASRNTNFSKTIVLPGNAANNKIFGHVFQFGSSNFYDPAQPNVGYNFNTAKSAACIVYVDKVQIFKGIIRILEIVIDGGSIEYECAVFGELGGFISNLGNKKIEELDFSAYDHLWNVDNIQNSWNNIIGSGYYYPLIDYGLVSSNDKLDWDVKAFRPAFYVKEYMDKIITGAGYTYECSFFNSAVFRRLIIPNNQKTLSGYSTTGMNIYTGEKIYDVNSALIEIEFPIQTTLGGFSSNVAKTIFTYTSATPKSGTFKVSLIGQWFTAYPGRVALKKNGTEIYQYSVGTGNSYNYFNVNFEIQNMTFNQNDTIELVFIRTGGNYLINSRLNVYMGNMTLVTDASELVPINYGESVVVNATLPKGIFQKDFFASIIKMFNIYVIEDAYKPKHLILQPYIEFYDQGGVQLLAIDDFNDLLKVNNQDFLLLGDATVNHLDWSYKIDRSKPIKIKPMSELNGRYFEYKYKNDADYYNDQYQKKYSQAYGTRIEDTGYEFAKEKQTAEIIFSATPLVGYTGRDKVISTIFKLNNGVEDITDHNIRILQAKKITGVTTWHIKNGGNIATLDSYGYAGHLDDPDDPQSDLNFGTPYELYFKLATPYPTANIFNAFWSEYIAEISDKDSKLMTCELYLTTKDIYSLDFSHLIYIDGTLFKLNNIQDFNPIDTKATKAEFLRVIELTYT